MCARACELPYCYFNPWINIKLMNAMARWEYADIYVCVCVWGGGGGGGGGEVCGFSAGH